MLKTKKIIREKLSPLYPPSEVDGLIRLILEHVTGFNRLQMHLKQTEPLPEPKIMQITEILNRLLTNEPIQYILGETEFYGLKFIVTPEVLIPRAETEELVDWIISEEKEHCKSLLDIGTGSGCIPIAIDKNSDIGSVEGWDISEQALQIARSNAEKNNSKVVFSCQDIFAPAGVTEHSGWDVIVSNPPYVLMEESALMERNVVDFEPHVALFVPDHDPLIFYRAIARFAAVHLQLHGSLYFEINEAMGDQTAKLLIEFGFQDIQIRRDLQGKSRMIKARKDVTD
ncbi:MAG: peptide chain release factor N(5)-glutamine methyltransferase [Prolixibacteraceae bacterium]|jgi:release factor glutamine methyltransferase|nr:peptide chain release factor N(5)-glutamine methyltransferase [Prolixibacteraceae bacterium]